MPNSAPDLPAPRLNQKAKMRKQKSNNSKSNAKGKGSRVSAATRKEESQQSDWEELEDEKVDKDDEEI